MRRPISQSPGRETLCASRSSSYSWTTAQLVPCALCFPITPGNLVPVVPRSVAWRLHVGCPQSRCAPLAFCLHASLFCVCSDGVGQVCGALLLGWLSDAQGRKPVLLLSFLGAAIGYHMASWAVGVGSIGLLLASRLPVGLAKQTVTATRAMISDITPADSSRSEALAKLFAWCSLGYAVGPLAGGLLADAAGSASPLPASICASIFVVLMPLGAWLLPETATLHAADATPQEPCVQPESIAIPQRSARRSRSPARRNASAVKALPREFRRVATSSANLPEGASAAARAGIEDKAGERLEGPPSALWAWVLLIGCTCSEAALTSTSAGVPRASDCTTRVGACPQVPSRSHCGRGSSALVVSTISVGSGSVCAASYYSTA